MDKLPILYGDGVTDDTEALQAMYDGKPYQLPSGEIVYPITAPDKRTQEDE